MNYHDYRPYDMLNGDGIRATLFVSGCTHGCKGCYNADTWNPDSGKLFTKELEDRIISDLKGEDGVRRQGLTLTGGDPLHAANLDTLLELVHRVREECPDKDIWLWTGYTWDYIDKKADFMEFIGTREDWDRFALATDVDYLIDGKYEQDKKDVKLLYRGSSNQNVYKHLKRIL